MIAEPGDIAGALVDALRPGTGIGVAVHDEALRVLVISPSLAELSGTEPGAQIGRRLTEALPGEVGRVAEASLRAVAASREPLLRLEPAVEAGRERGWLIHVYPLEREGRELIAVIALDVTESRRAHEHLQRTRERLDSAQRMARVGSWTWDVVADGWHWSEELYRIAGLSPAGPPPDFAELLAAIPAGSRDAIRHESQQRAAAALGQLALSGVPLDVLTRAAADVVAEALVGEEDAAFTATVANVLASASVRLEKGAEVAAQSEARGRLVALALDAEDRARRVISEALRDGPLQDLLALGHDIARLRPVADGDDEHLGRVRDGLARAVSQIREVMLDLHPVQLQVGGLEAALHAICSQHASAGGYACHVEIEPAASGRHDELVLSLARELLRNVAKHARASEVVAHVTAAAGAVRLEVIDDGVGFAPDRLADALAQGHIGVASGRERAEAIGGSFRTGPRDDGRPGTQAVALLPA